ncbi:MAG TPA: hypothetical protein VJ801_04640 [Polyangia bacterium]|jgi:hypothetical protein|nr:hypothetical protein [Polyangia bacterium]
MTLRDSKQAFLIGLLLLAAQGCATTPTETWQVRPPVVRGSSSGPPPGMFGRRRRAGPEHSNSAVGVVERSLHERGIRFGTDGTPGSLYQFLHGQYPEVPASEARPGDVLFFDMGDGSGCGAHTGLVDLVDSGGRLMFREWRDGSARRSYVHPGQPHTRRDGAQIMNTFMRIKLPDDPPSARYFAGELLCSVVRPQP